MILVRVNSLNLCKIGTTKKILHICAKSWSWTAAVFCSTRFYPASLTHTGQPSPAFFHPSFCGKHHFSKAFISFPDGLIQPLPWLFCQGWYVCFVSLVSNYNILKKYVNLQLLPDFCLEPSRFLKLLTDSCQLSKCFFALFQKRSFRIFC